MAPIGAAWIGYTWADLAVLHLKARTIVDEASPPTDEAATGVLPQGRMTLAQTCTNLSRRGFSNKVNLAESPCEVGAGDSPILFPRKKRLGFTFSVADDWPANSYVSTGYRVVNLRFFLEPRIEAARSSIARGRHQLTQMDDEAKRPLPSVVSRT